ncbi:hypothetical protein CAFE_11340 [Caprobacter fermentans]|uniref:AAA domain-containing protein n=1 Tax=Caproicibacter fermentans TaxID=2576756 RepID=A0A6N8HXW8_9FIRM|nr:ParA family protein [Caproicibacter fermentans]MVB10445.1 hypothetical protein [Caproicibacter fermentans]
MGSNPVIAAWGSPGSGTTVTALKVALELSARKSNVILVLCDDAVPGIPLIAPSFTENKSLGHLLSLPELTQISILEHCIPVENSLSLLGYQRGENELSYSEYTPTRAKDLFALIRNMADYIVIDCHHQMMVNDLTAAALESSEIVLQITNADPKSLICIKSQSPYLAEERFHYDRHVNIINNVLPLQDPAPYIDKLGGNAYLLPHVDELHRQFYESRLLEPIYGRGAKEYNGNLKKIIKEVILNE